MNSLTTLSFEISPNGIAVITLSRPEKLNALSAQVISELESVFLACKNDSKVKALLITGNGKAFCAGAEISELRDANALTGSDFAKHGQRVFRLLETLGKPSLAAINGYAFGGGCELAMAATLRIANEKAQFGQPEVKLGVIPGFGGTVRLPRLVGKGRALDLCITGRFIDAKTAKEWGLVSDVVAETELLTVAQQWLEKIMAQSPLAVKAAMQSIDGGFDLTMEDAHQLEALYFAQLCATEDKTEGVQAFLEKRTAQFCGK